MSSSLFMPTTRSATTLLAALALALGAAGAQAQAGATPPPPPQPVAATSAPGALPAANAAAREARKIVALREWRSDGSDASTDTAARPWSTDPAVIEQGRKLYSEGLRSDGSPLVGLRLDGQVRIAGAAAACVLCHRKSGLGAVEGANQIAPITGRYLFDQDRRAVVNMSIRARKAFNQRHAPHTLDTLAHALRDGHGVDGRAFDALMPHYLLADSEVLALASYLRTLSNAWSPGVSEKLVRFATIITPDVDAHRKAVFLQTLQGIVAQKNGNIIPGQRTMSSGAEMVLQTDRRWDLQVWELQGPASTWQVQLQRFYAQQPVFAVASGLGAGNWEPIHEFCEKQGLPCWFPSVGAVPTASDNDYYSVYFSRGATLEAEVLAQHLARLAQAEVKPAPGLLLQVWADASVAHTAVAALRERVGATGLTAQEFVLGQAEGGVTDPASVAALGVQLARLGPNDTAVVWLTPRQLDAIGKLPRPKAKVYFSASLGGADQITVPQAWRDQAQLIYPYQLPDVRQRGLTYFKEWMRVRDVALTDEVLQSEVFFAMSYLNDTAVEMLDNVHRDYLLERCENMLSLREAAKTEDEARELSLPKAHLAPKDAQQTRQFASRPIVPRRYAHAKPASQTMAAMASADAVSPQVLEPGQELDSSPVPSAADIGADPIEARGPGVSAGSGAPESTTVYPRMSLGQFQRHASKGAYIVRLGPTGVRVESDWLVP